ncbi:hypothetical protein PG996_013441 [Apiospora saccharicola]|uniref:Uncharacterized protein n=1 Tax=Apiospora saccharicola TaxID=335842 RepID=A0ABR1U7U3_9PEZI
MTSTASADDLAPFLPKGVKLSPAESPAPVEVSKRVVGVGELETVVMRALLDDVIRKKMQARLGNES